jgi:hypothetical protein
MKSPFKETRLIFAENPEEKPSVDGGEAPETAEKSKKKEEINKELNKELTEAEKNQEIAEEIVKKLYGIILYSPVENYNKTEFSKNISENNINLYDYLTPFIAEKINNVERFKEYKEDGLIWVWTNARGQEIKEINPLFKHKDLNDLLEEKTKTKISDLEETIKVEQESKKLNEEIEKYFNRNIVEGLQQVKLIKKNLTEKKINYLNKTDLAKDIKGILKSIVRKKYETILTKTGIQFIPSEIKPGIEMIEINIKEDYDNTMTLKNHTGVSLPNKEEIGVDFEDLEEGKSYLKNENGKWVEMTEEEFNATSEEYNEKYKDSIIIGIQDQTPEYQQINELFEEVQKKGNPKTDEEKEKYLKELTEVLDQSADKNDKLSAINEKVKKCLPKIKEIYDKISKGELEIDDVNIYQEVEGWGELEDERNTLYSQAEAEKDYNLLATLNNYEKAIEGLMVLAYNPDN